MVFHLVKFQLQSLVLHQVSHELILFSEWRWLKHFLKLLWLCLWNVPLLHGLIVVIDSWNRWISLPHLPVRGKFESNKWGYIVWSLILRPIDSNLGSLDEALFFLYFYLNSMRHFCFYILESHPLKGCLTGSRIIIIRLIRTVPMENWRMSWHWKVIEFLLH